VEARLSEPFATASGTLPHKDLILLRLEGDDGCVGYGEASPLAVPTELVMAAIADCVPVLEGSDGRDHQHLVATCRDLAVLPEALAAVDLALWDLAGKRAKTPVWQILGAANAAETPVNATIAAPDRASAAAQAGAAAAAGFGCVKVKVGLGDDAGRLAAVRAAAGREMEIRIDANGAWSVAEARSALRALAAVGIELCEEPVHGLEETADLFRDCPVPIAIDESAAAPGALDRRVCDAVCLKVSRSGGISGLIGSARRAHGAGYEVYVASMLDGPLGIAAALHAAAVIGADRPCGLATLGLFADRDDPMPPRQGVIPTPAGPGLGIDPGPWY
jgi:L-alanine-DL-glutamate epimerase-like enolase superfamily enzyme